LRFLFITHIRIFPQVQIHRLYIGLDTVHCVSKKDPDIIGCNLFGKD